MPAGQLKDVVKYLRHLTAPQGLDDLSDAELLERFGAHRDESAFTGLLRRHGPMVLGVCRRILGNAADAEDAFQVVFLVLARKASSLKRRGAVGGWLHGVARNTALKARAVSLKRRAKEREAMATRPTGRTEDIWPELCGLLDEELARLPKQYREAIILCDLEGKTIRQASRHLGRPQGTVASRLARGRMLLAGHLRRHGLALSAGALAMAITQTVSANGLPPRLMATTLRAATAAATGQAATAAVTTKVTLLTEEVMKSMLWQKIRGLVTAAIVPVVVLTGVLGIAGLPAASLQQAKEAGKTAEVAGDQELAKCDAFGDPLPPRGLARLGTSRLRHSDYLSQARFTSDGKALLTTGRDGLIRVWDISTGKEWRHLGREIRPELRPGCREYVLIGLRSLAVFAGYARTGVVFSGDGRIAAEAELDGTVSIWDVASGRELYHLDGTQKHGGGVFGLGLSADGQKLVSRGVDESLVIWDAQTGKELRQLPTEPASKSRMGVFFGIGGESVENYVFSKDGEKLATIDVDAEHHLILQVWNVTAGKELWRTLDKDGASLNPPAFSADGKTLVRLAADKSVRVHDATTGEELRRITETRAGFLPTWSALAPDGRFFAVQTGEGVVLLYDLEIGKIIHEFGQKVAPRYGGSCTAIAFSPDGKTLAQGVDFNSVRLWGVATGKAWQGPGIGHGGPIAALAVSPDGKEVTTVACDSMLRVWDLATGKERRRLPLSDSHDVALSERNFMALPADSRLLAVCADDGLHLRETANGKEVLRLAKQPPGSPIRSARFSADGGRIASASSGVQPHDNWVVRVWDVTSGKERHQISGESWMGNAPPEFDRYLADYALSPDGTLLLTLASEPGLPKPGGNMTTDFFVRLRDVDTGAELWSVESEEPLRSGVFSPDGRMLAAASTECLVVYEVASGKERARFKAPAWKLAFSPDGRVLAAAEGSSVRLWDVPVGKSIGQLTGHLANVESLTFTMNGRTLVTTSADSTGLVWDLARLVPRPKSTELDTKQVQSLWSDLGSENAGKAYRAIVTLGASPQQVVPWLRACLKPATPPDGERIARLIAQLDSDDFVVRTNAAKDLESLGDLAWPAFRKALEGQLSAEVRRRIETLLASHKTGKVLPIELRLIRAIEVLEQAANADARALLEVLAKGASGARLTREAQSTLQRLDRSH